MATDGGSHWSMATGEANAGSEEDQVRLYGLINLLPEPPPSGGVAGGTAIPHNIPPPLVRPPGAMAAASSTGAGATAGACPVAEGQGRGGGKAAARRRRPRAASRRAPTTVLNTDAYNFRANVQQFTGAHPNPFQAGGAVGQAATLGFGLGGGAVAQLYQPQAAVFPFGSAQQQQQQQQQQLQLDEGRRLFSSERSGHVDVDSSASGGDAFLRGFVQGGHEADMPAGVFLPAEGVSPASQDQVPPRRGPRPPPRAAGAP